MNMAKKKDVPEKPLPVLPDLSKLTISITGKAETAVPVDSLAADLGISPPVLAGLKTAFGWTPSTRITRSEFAGKVKSWLGASAGGR